MKSTQRSGLLLLLALAFLSFGCDKDEDGGDEVKYPVWILRAYVYDSLTDQPVEPCARIVWHFAGSTETHTQTCHSNGNHIVKIWGSMDESVTIYYRVEADGYFPSPSQSAFFNIDLAEQLPGRPGPELLIQEEIHLTPQ